MSQLPAGQSLVRRLEAGGALFFPAVAGPAQPFLAAFCHHQFPQRTLVAVTENLKAQENVQQDLETWLGGPPRFYPAWEVFPHEGKLPHADVISDRLETLVTLAAGPALVVTSVTALLQKTFAPADLKNRTRRWRRGDKIAPLDLIEILEAQGYEPEAQVSQKGELALRGGIVDVFPLTSPWPVRLEFFGDELESLRYFDPLTQISRAEITEITLPPAGEVGFLRQRETSFPEREERPLATLLDHLPKDAIFILCDPEALAAQAEAYAGQIPRDDPFFVTWPDFRSALHQCGLSVIELAGETSLPEENFPEKNSRFESVKPEVPPLPTSGHPLLHSEWRTGPGREFPVPRFAPGSPEPRSASSPDLRPPSPPWEMEERDGERRRSGSWRRGAGEKGVSEPQPEAKSAGDFAGSADLAFVSLDAFRPLVGRAQEPQIADAQRREFFQQLHRWLRQEYAVLVFCNNEGERQRFEEIWKESGLTAGPAPVIHLGSLARGFLWESARFVVVTDAEIFGRYKVQRPRRLKSPHALATRSALDIDFTDLEEGDLVVHLQHGIGRYRGLKSLPLGAGPRPPDTECLVIEYAPGDPAVEPPKLYVPVSEAHLVSKYVGAGKANPPLNSLGGTRWAKAREQTEQAVRDVAAELLRIQAVRETQIGHAFKPDTAWQREFESAFIYEETPDQLTAIAETKADLERPKPMDRLICGDVGFGKTEVAIRAAFKAVMDGKQVAILVPTTVLAQQHFNNFRERMADYPIRIELLSRFRTPREQKKVVSGLASGTVDIIIGTHRIVQEDIFFKDLGLVVIDEEQRFGVMHKEKFKRLRTLVDVLTLSATPIPRTLYLALTGARDMSTIQTPPHDRLPVETVATAYDERLIRDAIQREMNRGGQVFFLHNRVTTIETVRAKLQSLLPSARIVVGHGQMNADELEGVMTTFVNGEADVLLSTTIIESGLDIPNANTIIIDRADRFGLSELYQLRGRVGRYKHQAYAYLLLPRHARLLTDVRKRISAMKQYSSLGSGFKIAMRDLEIRGAGNLLGAEQSGHITAVGFDLYCQLLKQSVGSLKGEKVKPRIEVRVALDFLDSHGGEGGVVAGASPYSGLPHGYITEPHHRIEIYRKLAQANEKPLLEGLQKELRDRFGPLPPPVELLLAIAELKILAAEKNVTSIEVAEDKLRLIRSGDFITLGGKFPRLTKKEPKARLKEIKRLLLAI